MSARQQLLALAAQHGLDVEHERQGPGIYIEVVAPEGQCFSGTGGSFLCTRFYSDVPAAWAEALRDVRECLPLEPAEDPE